MKTTLLALAAAAPVMAGTVTTTTYVQQPEPVNPYSIEAGISYNFAARNIFKVDNTAGPKVDTLGVDITGVYTVNENSSYNLRFGFMTGSDSRSYDYFFRVRARVNDFFLMPGYRYTHRWDDNFSGYIGANIGVINQSVKMKYSAFDDYARAHGSDYGFAYSAEVGVRYSVSRDFDIFLAYQFFGSTAEVGRNGDGDFGFSTRSQIYHGIRAGVSFDF